MKNLDGLKRNIDAALALGSDWLRATPWRHVLLRRNTHRDLRVDRIGQNQVIIGCVENLHSKYIAYL